MKTTTTDPLVPLIHAVLEEGKALDVVDIDLRGRGAYCDQVVIASGTSNRHLAALAERIRIHVKQTLERFPLGVEGEQEGEWVLMDYGDVVVHLFQPEVRALYDLESLWNDKLPTRRSLA